MLPGVLAGAVTPRRASMLVGLVLLLAASTLPSSALAGTLVVSKYSSEAPITATTHYEPSKTLASYVVLEFKPREGVSLSTLTCEVSGSLAVQLQQVPASKTAEELTAGPFLVGAGQYFACGLGGAVGTASYRYATVEDEGGKEGKAGAEGKEGKEGPAGPKGEAGAAGPSGKVELTGHSEQLAEISENSMRGAVFVGGCIGGLLVLGLAWKVVRP